MTAPPMKRGGFTQAPTRVRVVSLALSVLAASCLCQVSMSNTPVSFQLLDLFSCSALNGTWHGCDLFIIPFDIRSHCRARTRGKQGEQGFPSFLLLTSTRTVVDHSYRRRRRACSVTSIISGTPIQDPLCCTRLIELIVFLLTTRRPIISHSSKMAIRVF